MYTGIVELGILREPEWADTPEVASVYMETVRFGTKMLQNLFLSAVEDDCSVIMETFQVYINF